MKYPLKCRFIAHAAMDARKNIIYLLRRLWPGR